MASIHKYLKELADQSKADDHMVPIMNFFTIYPNPSDDQVHEFAERLGINPHKLEQTIYKLLGSFLGAGRSLDFKGTYNPEELSKGIEIEMEHTTNKVIAERIARDHLAEFSDYYTRLIKMEKEAENEL